MPAARRVNFAAAAPAEAAAAPQWPQIRARLASPDQIEAVVARHDQLV